MVPPTEGHELTEALMQLCEFIEDCEYSNLAVRILHLLGSEGPKTPKPANIFGTFIIVLSWRMRSSVQLR